MLFCNRTTACVVRAAQHGPVAQGREGGRVKGGEGGQQFVGARQPGAAGGTPQRRPAHARSERGRSPGHLARLGAAGQPRVTQELGEGGVGRKDEQIAVQRLLRTRRDSRGRLWMAASGEGRCEETQAGRRLAPPADEAGERGVPMAACEPERGRVGSAADQPHKESARAQAQGERTSRSASVVTS